MSYPAGFTLVSESGVEESIPLATTSNAVAQGDMLALAVGATTWADATATTEHWQIKAIASETIGTGDSVCKCQLVKPLQLWAVELANSSDAAHNGDRMILTDTNTVNNTGTDSTSQCAVFIQLYPVGAAADKRAIGFFVFGSGVDPDAT